MTRSGARRIRYSVFDPAFVSALVESTWGWKAPRCEYWNRGHNDTYRIEAGKQRAYLRISRHGWKPRAQIEGEIELLRYLDRSGVRVACPIEARDGTFMARLNAPEGTRYAVLFAEAHGSVPAMNGDNSRKYGRLAANLHRAADECTQTFARPSLDMDHLVREPLRQLQPFLAARPRDWTYLTRVADSLANAAATALPMATPAIGLCHGDLHFGNVHRDARGRFTLFDFDCSGYGWRAYDVAVFLWSRGWDFDRAARASRARQWNAFLEGYHAVRRLPEAELRTVNLFVPLRHLWLLGMHARLDADFGRRWLGDAHLDRHIAFIRAWVRTHPPA